MAYGHGRWAEAASTGALNMEFHRDIILNYVLPGFGIPKLGMAWKAQGEKKVCAQMEMRAAGLSNGWGVREPGAKDGQHRLLGVIARPALEDDAA